MKYEIIRLEKPIPVIYGDDNKMSIDALCGRCGTHKIVSLPESYKSPSVRYTCKNCDGYKTLAELNYDKRKYPRIDGSDLLAKLITGKEPTLKSYGNGMSLDSLFANLSVAFDDGTNDAPKGNSYRVRVKDVSLNGAGLNLNQLKTVIDEMKVGDIVFMEYTLPRDHSLVAKKRGLLLNPKAENDIVITREGIVKNIDQHGMIVGIEYVDDPTDHSNRHYNLFVVNKVGKFRIEKDDLKSK